MPNVNVVERLENCHAAILEIAETVQGVSLYPDDETTILARCEDSLAILGEIRQLIDGVPMGTI